MPTVRRQQALLYVTLFNVLIGFGIVVPILPFFARSLGATSLQMGLLVTIWAGAQFMFSPIWGSLSDRIGRRPVLLIGLTGYCITFFLMGMAGSIWMLLLARFLGGMISAATIPAAQAYMADTTGPEDRSRKMAGMGAAMNLGFITGPMLGGLIAPLGAHVAFFAAGTLAVINLIASYCLLPEPDRREARAGRRTLSGLGAVGLALRGPEALLFLLTLAATFGGSSMFSMLGFYLMDRLGAGEQLTGIAFMIEGAAAVLFQILAVGPVMRCFGEVSTVRIALISGIAGFGALTLATRFWQVAAGLILISFAVDCLRPVITALVSARTRLEQGVTMGIQTSFDALGRTIGPLVAGVVYTLANWAPFAIATAVFAIFLLWSSALSAPPAARPETEP